MSFWKSLAKWAIEQAAKWGVSKIGTSAHTAAKPGTSKSPLGKSSATSVRRPSR